MNSVWIIKPHNFKNIWHVYLHCFLTLESASPYEIILCSLSFLPSFCRASVLPSSLSRRRRDFHHTILSSHNTTIPRYNSTGSERPLKWSLPWGEKDSQQNRCIRDCYTEENERKYLFLYHRYLYIYAFVHKCLIILYIRLFSYWKGLFY